MLDQRQVDQFFERGFVRVDGVFRPEELQPIRCEFDRLLEMAYGLGRAGMHRGAQFVLTLRTGTRPRVDRVVWCGAAAPRLFQAGADARLLRPVARLLGSDEMSQLINQAHFKLPGDGLEFEWHQDSTHRRFGGGEWRDVNGRGSYVQSVLAVDDMTEDNGPLEFIPGSCRHGHLPLVDGKLPNVVDPATAVAVTMPAGSVVFFGPYTFHRSGPNRSSGPRRVLINGFAYPGANSRVYPGAGAGRLLRAG